MMNQCITLVAGEASGDLLGAALARELLKQYPDLTLVGMGGREMQAAGVDIIINADQLAVVGIAEVIKKLPKIRHAFRQLDHLFTTQKPNLLILIDYPGFNLRLAKLAKRYHIPVMFYVSPQIWAWRQHRIHHIKRYVDHMAVLFAFEKKIYQQAKIPVTHVGHALVDLAQPTLSREAAYPYFQLKPDQPVIVLMPGSRQQEIERLLPVMTGAKRLLKASYPNAQFVLPVANTLNTEDITPYLTQDPDIQLTHDHTYDLLNIAQAAIVTSGTATLEVALLKVPMVIVYRLNTLSYWLGRLMLKLNHIGLCNIVLEQSAVKELIQHDATPEAVTKEIKRLMDDRDYRQQQIHKLSQVCSKLGDGNSSQKSAEIALSLLKSAQNCQDSRLT